MARKPKVRFLVIRLLNREFIHLIFIIAVTSLPTCLAHSGKMFQRSNEFGDESYADPEESSTAPISVENLHYINDGGLVNFPNLRKNLQDFFSLPKPIAREMNERKRSRLYASSIRQSLRNGHSPTSRKKLGNGGISVTRRDVECPSDSELEIKTAEELRALPPMCIEIAAAGGGMSRTKTSNNQKFFSGW